MCTDFLDVQKVESKKMRKFMFHQPACVRCKGAVGAGSFLNIDLEFSEAKNQIIFDRK